MSRVVYVNGEFLPEAAAKISVFDRGFLFADAVYEVTSVVDGRLVDSAAHMTRLARSLGELRIEMPFDAGEIEMIERELIKRNGLHEGGVYLQVGRGAADRDFAFPRQVKPSLVIFTQAKKLVDNPAAWRKAKAHPPFRKHFILTGESLQRPPRGYPKEHELSEDLKRKDFIACRAFDDEAIGDRALLQLVIGGFQQSDPFMRYLCAALELPY